MFGEISERRNEKNREIIKTLIRRGYFSIFYKLFRFFYFDILFICLHLQCGESDVFKYVCA